MIMRPMALSLITHLQRAGRPVQGWGQAQQPAGRQQAAGGWAQGLAAAAAGRQQAGGQEQAQWQAQLGELALGLEPLAGGQGRRRRGPATGAQAHWQAWRQGQVRALCVYQGQALAQVLALELELVLALELVLVQAQEWGQVLAQESVPALE